MGRALEPRDGIGEFGEERSHAAESGADLTGAVDAPRAERLGQQGADVAVLEVGAGGEDGVANVDYFEVAPDYSIDFTHGDPTWFALVNG